MLTDLSGRQKNIAVILAGLAVGAFGAIVLMSDTGEQTAPGVTTQSGPEIFAGPPGGYAAPVMFGPRIANVSLPEGVEAAPYENLAIRLNQGQWTVAFVESKDIVSVLEANPDARILPYTLLIDSEPGIYVERPSNISEPAELAGKRIGVPNVPDVTADELLAALEQEHNVSLQEFEPVRLSHPTRNNVSTWYDHNLDAAFSQYPQETAVNPVLRYHDVVEEPFGSDRIVSAFFIVSGPEKAEVGYDVLAAIDHALSELANRPEEFLTGYAEAIGQPEENLAGYERWITYRNGDLLKPMGPEERESLQYRLELRGEDALNLTARLIEDAPSLSERRIPE